MGGKLIGITFRGELLGAKKLGKGKYVVQVAGKSFKYDYAQDAASHFVALDATRLSSAAAAA